jgi:hypothetical protein
MTPHPSDEFRTSAEKAHSYDFGDVNGDEPIMIRNNNEYLFLDEIGDPPDERDNDRYTIGINTG